MTRYLRNRITRAAPVTITLDGAALVEGTVITDDTMRDVVIRNGIVQVDYRAPSPSGQAGATFLSTWNSGTETYELAVSAQYGDWFYWVETIDTRATRMRVITANVDCVRIALEWDSYVISPSVNAYGPSNELIYLQNQSSPNFLKISTLRKLVKVIELQRGRDGYFSGVHSVPSLAPQIDAGATYEHDGSRGERERGLGSGSEVAFASSGLSARFPEWGEGAVWDAVDAAWGGAGLDNHAWWPGVSDTTAFSQSPYTAPQQAAYAAAQPDGFPQDQAVGPWWVADLTATHCRYLVMQDRNEIGVWCYDGQLGVVVQHITNPNADDTNRPRLFQTYIGAFAYASADLGAEPTAGLSGRVALLAGALDWPQ